ncbi:MAG: hypothetical protein AB1555_13620 [Nitrospirota bacterium]
MSGFLRTMIAVGVLALLAGVLTLWRQYERPVSSSAPLSEAPDPTKVVGSSALSHGGPTGLSTKLAFPPQEMLSIRPGQRVTLIEFPPTETEADRFAEPVSVYSDVGPAARRSATEVIVTNVETRPAPNGRVEQFFQVRFPDGRSAWVHKNVLRVPASGNDLAYTER